ncbi:MAG: glycosyltransferase family 2 protein [Caulobacteraceae bacterium]
MTIALLIPTLRRPEGLTRALRSVFAQTGAPLAEIVVIDNSPEASSREIVEALKTDAPMPIVFVHAPQPGVATARNAGLRATKAPLIAFLDDDEEAPPGWLAALHDAHTRFNADVTFGPVRGVTPEETPSWAKPYLDRFFSREGPATSGPIDQVYGCGDSMMTRATVLAGDAPFDTGLDQTGGEDDRLFARAQAAGARFAWSAEAWVWEYAPPHRARMSYALKRAFGYGQSPSQICAHADPPDWPGVARWMAVGAVQAGGYGAAAAGLWLLKRPGRAEMADRAARGLGKLFWTRAPRFYGQAEVARTNPG